MSDKIGRFVSVPPGDKVHVLTVIRHPVGGIRTYIKYVYSLLPPQRFRFTFVVVGADEVFAPAKELEHHTAQLVEVRGSQPTARLLRAVSRALCDKSVNVIHAQGFTAGAISAVANVAPRLPHLITSHDVLRGEQFKGVRGRIKLAVLSALLGRADVVQSVGQEAQANLETMLPTLRRKVSLTVIPNGIRIGRSVPAEDAAEWRARHTVSTRTCVFGFFGRLMPQKGFEYVVEAVDRLSTSGLTCEHFVVLVMNDGGYIREQREALERRGLGRYFRFTGFAPTIIPTLHQIQSVLMPSLWEAGPLLPMEALVAGCPLIASTCIGLREVVEGTPAILVPPGDAGRLADAMRLTMTAHGDRRMKAEEFASQAVDRYDARHTAQALDRLLTGLATRA